MVSAFRLLFLQQPVIFPDDALHNTECDRRNTRLGERVIREYNRVLEEKAKRSENDGYRQEAINL